MFNGKLENTSTVLIYQATAQKIDPNKKGQKLTAEHMARDQIKDAGFEGRATNFECPPAPIDGATAVCYKMSGDSIFNGKARPEKWAIVLVAVSSANDTQGYILMGTAVEKDVTKFNSDPTVTEKNANKALGSLWKYHQVTLN